MSREECAGSTILALKLGGSTAPSSRPLWLARVPSARDKISCRQVCKVIIDGGNFTNTISSDVVHAKTVSKLWTALFGGKEDDEPMAPQVNITASVELLGNNIKCPFDGAGDPPSFSVGEVDPAHSSRDMPVNLTL